MGKSTGLLKVSIWRSRLVSPRLTSWWQFKASFCSVAILKRRAGETRRTTKGDVEKKRAKGFQGFLYGTSGEEIPRVSLRDLRGAKKKIKTGTYH